MPKPIELKPLDDFQLFVRFDDGFKGIVDLSEYAGSGVFSLWDDYNAFRNVHIASGGGISWSDEVELCPDAIYLTISGMTPEDLFPKLRELRHYAGN